MFDSYTGEEIIHTVVLLTRSPNKRRQEVKCYVVLRMCDWSRWHWKLSVDEKPPSWVKPNLFCFTNWYEPILYNLWFKSSVQSDLNPFYFIIIFSYSHIMFYSLWLMLLYAILVKPIFCTIMSHACEFVFSLNLIFVSLFKNVTISLCFTLCYI